MSAFAVILFILIVISIILFCVWYFKLRQNCKLSDWSACDKKCDITAKQTRTVINKPDWGGDACGALSQSCYDCPTPPIIPTPTNLCPSVDNCDLNYCNNLTGPYPTECLQSWWKNAGCNKPLFNIDNTSWWQSQTPQTIRNDMDAYKNNTDYSPNGLWKSQMCTIDFTPPTPSYTVGECKSLEDCDLKYCNNSTKPYNNNCLTKWWQQAGCTNLNTTLTQASDGWWNTQPLETVKTDMTYYPTNDDFSTNNLWKTNICYGDTFRPMTRAQCDELGSTTQATYPRQCLKYLWKDVNGCINLASDQLQEGKASIYDNKTKQQVIDLMATFKTSKDCNVFGYSNANAKFFD